MAVTKPCSNCGKPVTRPVSLHKHRHAYCDMECRKASNRWLVTCAGCKREFPRNPKQPSRRYCTWECFKASRHVELTCTVCGKTFSSYLSEARKREVRGHVACCSRACRNVYTSRFLGGDGTWTPGRHSPKRQRPYPWRKLRAAYLDSVAGMCEGCEGVSATQVHHLWPTAGGGPLLDWDNLMAVCDDCHTRMHESIRAGEFWDSFEAVGA